MIHHHRDASAQYQPTLDDLAEDVQRAVACLLTRKTQFDGLVVQGMSGVIPGVPVSLATGLPLVVIRKDGDSTHDDRHINFHLVEPGTRWVFLDDFIASGNTRERVVEAIQEGGGEVVAQYMCREEEFSPIPEYVTRKVVTYDPEPPPCDCPVCRPDLDRRSLAGRDLETTIPF